MTWKTANRAVHEGAERGLRAGADLLLAASTKVAPIESDHLIKSARASVDYPRAAVSYDTPYAVIQHENLSERHDAGREGKYLERPLHSEAPAIARAMAAEVRKATN